MSGQRHAPAALNPGKGPPVPIVQAAGWASEPVWTQRLEEKSFASSGDRSLIAPGRPVCSQTLYWLSYPSSCQHIIKNLFLPREIIAGMNTLAVPTKNLFR
jgi:hypothetical protein